jgi:hypothetical protein
MFEWIIGNGMQDPAWVQAYSSAALVILSFVTLAVLCLYAWDTHKLAKASVEQVKNAQMPFLALVKADKDVDPITARVSALSPPTYPAWAVQNQGSAAAVNVRVRGECAERTANAPSSFSEPLNPIPVGAYTFLRVHSSAQIRSCTIEYVSLAGREFRTEITTENGELRLVFRRL